MMFASAVGDGIVPDVGARDGSGEGAQAGEYVG